MVAHGTALCNLLAVLPSADALVTALQDAAERHTAERHTALEVSRKPGLLALATKAFKRERLQLCEQGLKRASGSTEVE